MATLHTYEDAVGGTTTNGINLKVASAATRVLFNNSGALAGGAALTATYVNTAGVGLSSGTGTIVYDSTYATDVVYLILADRTSFGAKLPNSSTSVTLTAAGFNHWGPTEARLRHLEYI